jgi:hypothetical protein
MGSVATMRRAPDFGITLLRTVQEHVTARAADSKEPDIPYICRALTDAVDNPTSRDATLLALAHYLSQSLAGIFPDL